MKRIAACLLFVICTVSCFANVNAIGLNVNGKAVDCSEREPVIENGRTLVPMRAALEALGAKVSWDDQTKTVTAEKNDTKITLTVGQSEMLVNSKAIALDVPSRIADGRTMIPVRAVSEALDCDVYWCDEQKYVSIFDKVDGDLSLEQALIRLEAIQPKSELDKESLLTVDGKSISAADVRYANNACSEYYASKAGTAEEKAAAISKEIMDYYSMNVAVKNVAEKYNVGISYNRFNKDVVELVAMLRKQYGDDYNTIFEQYAYQTPYGFFANNLYNLLYGNLFEKLYGVGADSEDSREAYAKALEDLKADNYIRAKHILICFPSKQPTDEQKAQALKKANEVLDKVKNGEDFDALVKQYGEDPGMTQYPDGYIFKKGEMVEPFEKAAYALEVGKCSDIVETEYGYHIILRLDIDDEKSVKASDTYQNYGYEALRSMLTENASGYKFEYADNYDTRIAQLFANPAQ